MNNTIAEAIRNRQVLEFYYKNHRRVVEPHTYGRDRKANEEKLSAWQTTGKPLDPPDWRYYEVALITELRVLPQSFAHARNGYKHNDPRMTTIHAQI